MYLVRGNFGVLAPVAGVIGAKIVLDLAFHLWSVYLYRRWIGHSSESEHGAGLHGCADRAVHLSDPAPHGCSLGLVDFPDGARYVGRQTRVGLVDADGARRGRTSASGVDITHPPLAFVSQPREHSRAEDKVLLNLLTRLTARLGNHRRFRIKRDPGGSLSLHSRWTPDAVTRPISRTRTPRREARPSIPFGHNSRPDAVGTL